MLIHLHAALDTHRCKRNTLIVSVCHCLVIVHIQYLALSSFTECIYVRLEIPSGPQLPCVGGRDLLAHNYSLKDFFFLIMWTLFDDLLPTYVNVWFLGANETNRLTSKCFFMIDTHWTWNFTGLRPHLHDRSFVVSLGHTKKTWKVKTPSNQNWNLNIQVNISQKFSLNFD